jgi:predicted membrane-bound spermidine synthase
MIIFLEICAAICILLGLACMVSERFFDLSVRTTSVGLFWQQTFVPRLGIVPTRFLYGLLHFALAGVILLVGYLRYRSW